MAPPVVAYRMGSVPELISHGVSGFIVENQDDAVKAVNNISLLDRRECRRYFEANFSAARMAKDYLHIYNKVLEPEKDIFDLKLI